MYALRPFLCLGVLIEKRFINALKPYAPNLKEGDFLSVPLNPQAHRVFTNAWRRALPYGSQYKLDVVIANMYEVYKDYPKLKVAVEIWLESIGVMN